MNPPEYQRLLVTVTKNSLWMSLGYLSSGTSSHRWGRISPFQLTRMVTCTSPFGIRKTSWSELGAKQQAILLRSTESRNIDPYTENIRLGGHGPIGVFIYNHSKSHGVGSCLPWIGGTAGAGTAKAGDGGRNRRSRTARGVQKAQKASCGSS